MLLPNPSAGGGYFVVRLYVDTAQEDWVLHRLVAGTFIPNPKGLPEVNHKDLDKWNNDVSNLEWVTRGENMRHAVLNGAVKSLRGSAVLSSKLTEDQVHDIRVRYANGLSYQRELAAEYGVSQAVISKILLRQNWAWLK